MTEHTHESNDRNYGIDLLRIIAMMMICMLHTLGQGGILNSVPPDSLHFHIAWLLEISSFCAVNCYAIISGYVLFDKPFSLPRITHLWLTIVFYTTLITIVMLASKQIPFDRKLIYNAIFPITRQLYWYLTAYFGMYLFSPFLIASIKTLGKRETKIIFLIAFVFLCILPSILDRDLFILNGGYSMLWLCVLFLVGASIKKYNFSISPIKSTVCFLASIFITYSSKLILPPIFFALWKIDNSGNMFVSYTSPTIVGAALSLFFLCKQVSIGKTITRFVKLFAPASLSVYIIQNHPLIWNCYMSNYAKNFVYDSITVFVLKIAVSVLSIWFFFSIIDLVRQSLFCHLKINSLCLKISHFTK